MWVDCWLVDGLKGWKDPAKIVLQLFKTVLYLDSWLLLVGLQHKMIPWNSFYSLLLDDLWLKISVFVVWFRPKKITSKYFCGWFSPIFRWFYFRLITFLSLISWYFNCILVVFPPLFCSFLDLFRSPNHTRLDPFALFLAAFYPPPPPGFGYLFTPFWLVLTPSPPHKMGWF